MTPVSVLTNATRPKRWTSRLPTAAQSRALHASVRTDSRSINGQVEPCHWPGYVRVTLSDGQTFHCTVHRADTPVN